jgi:DNA sulfur modification protein DndE
MVQTIDTIRLSEKQKQQLMRLKTKTGIDNWNVLCRWALCMSLAEKSTPPLEDIPSDSNIEMSWKVFAGEHSEVYLAVLREAFNNQKRSLEGVHFIDFVKLHINRGINIYGRTGKVKG